MGSIIQANPSDVFPYQRHLRLEKLAKLLPFFMERRTNELFPCAVGNFPIGRVVINGHHRFFLADLFKVDVDAYEKKPENH